MNLVKEKEEQLIDVKTNNPNNIKITKKRVLFVLIIV